MKMKIDGGQTLFLGLLFTLLIANVVAQSVVRKDLECTEGSRWRIDDCNWCTCITGFGSCTQKVCHLVNQDFNEPECDGISSWKEYFGGTCSQCDCKKGKKFCHSIHCSSSVNGRSSVVITSYSEVARRDYTCTAGSRWRVNCNWCRCGLDRTGLCEDRYCVPGEQDPNEKECDGVSEWKEYRADGTCTKCECKYGKSFCFSILCSSGTTIGKSISAPESHELTRGDYECTSLSRWRDNCNWCRCASNGLGICTKRACIPGKQDPFEPECEGISEWKEIRGGLCTKCECKVGKRYCYSISCSTRVGLGRSLARGRSLGLIESHEISRSDFECTALSRWRINCNWCRCGYDRTGICENRYCVPGAQNPSEPECEGVSEWKEYKAGSCSKCECKFGKRRCYSISCSSLLNVGKTNLGRLNIGKSLAVPAYNEVSRRDFECTSGSRWRDKCNWCRCALDGTGFCLFGACPPGSISPFEPECYENSEWKEIRGGLCTKCECKSGKRFCYSISCSSRVSFGKSLAVPATNEISRRDFECTAGSRWRDACNWCRCAFDGTGFCNFGTCPPGSVSPFEPECEGDSEWKEYRSDKSCTKCECRAGKGFCYSISCASRVNVAVAIHPIAPVFNELSRRDYECTAGSRWRDECNWCRCSADGTGICTRRICDPGTLDPEEPQCEGVSEWKEHRSDGSCFTCECKGGRSYCRSIPCSSRVAVGKSLVVPEYNEVSRKEFTCTAGSHWRDRCNWCRCALDSTGMCTSQFCTPGVTYSDQCIGSSSWRTYKNGQCSSCECRHEKAFCNPVLC